MNNKTWRAGYLDGNKIFALTLANPCFSVKAAILEQDSGKCLMT